MLYFYHFTMPDKQNSMGFKKTTRSLDFADPALANCLVQNCSINFTTLNAFRIYQSLTGKPNRDFLALNNVDDGIIRWESTTTKLTELEVQRNKGISKIRYVACAVACHDNDALSPNIIYSSEVLFAFLFGTKKKRGKSTTSASATFTADQT